MSYIAHETDHRDDTDYAPPAVRDLRPLLLILAVSSAVTLYGLGSLAKLILSAFTGHG